jgi:hypothetical protein
MLRTVSGIGTVRAKSVFAKEKNPPSTREQGIARGNEPSYSKSEGRGFEPLPSIRTFKIAGYLSKTACGSVGLLCQLGHIREKLLRLADEKTHVCQESQCSHGSALSFGRPNDRNDGKAST